MDVDDCLAKIVGSFGRYQFTTYCFLSIYLLFLTSHALLVVFIGIRPADLIAVNSRANQDSSILVEWDLTSQPWIGDLIQTLYFGGNLLGVIFFGHLSDKYGRRPTLIFVLTLLFPTCMWTSYTTRWEAFACARFLTGFLQGSSCLIIYVYIQEIVGRDWWAVAGAFSNILFALGIGVMSVFAYYIPAWRQLIRAVSYIQVIPLIYVFFLPESPRWLYSAGRIHDAEIVLTYMAGKNGVKSPKINLEKKTESHPSRKDVGSSYTVLDLFKHVKTRKRMLIMIVLWFANSFVYYALTLAAGSIGSNIYISTAMSGLIELPSTLLCTAMIERRRFGRKKTLFLFMLISGAACFAVLTTRDSALIWGLIGKMTIAASFNVIYVFTPELFPTPVRNAALGACSMSARFGSMTASMTRSLDPGLSYFIFGVTSFMSGSLSLLLPETLDSKPPDSFQDL